MSFLTRVLSSDSSERPGLFWRRRVRTLLPSFFSKYMPLSPLPDMMNARRRTVFERSTAPQQR